MKQPEQQEIEDFANAAMDGKINIVRSFLAKYPDAADVRDSSNSTALILAAEQGHDDTIRLLLTHGAGIDNQDSAGCTALMWAARRNHPDAVNCLLDRKADPNLQDNRNATALIFAAVHGDKKMVEALLESGASPDITNENGGTALSLATSFRRDDIISVLEQWPEKIKQRENEQWLAETDCSKGLKRSMRAPRPLKPHKP